MTENLDNLVPAGHLKRGVHVEYEGISDIDAQLVEAVIRVTREIAERLEKLGPVMEG